MFRVSRFGVRTVIWGSFFGGLFVVKAGRLKGDG